MKIKAVAREIVIALCGGYSDELGVIVADILEKYYSDGVDTATLIMDCRKSLAAAVPELRKIQQLCRAGEMLIDAAQQDNAPEHDRIKQSDLSRRAYNVIKCHRYGYHGSGNPIHTWTKLAAKIARDLSSYRGLGPVIKSELRAALARRGLRFIDE